MYLTLYNSVYFVNSVLVITVLKESLLSNSATVLLSANTLTKGGIRILAGDRSCFALRKILKSRLSGSRQSEGCIRP